jgi:hypothetical protein
MSNGLDCQQTHLLRTDPTSTWHQAPLNAKKYLQNRGSGRTSNALLVLETGGELL